MWNASKKTFEVSDWNVLGGPPRGAGKASKCLEIRCHKYPISKIIPESLGRGMRGERGSREGRAGRVTGGDSPPSEVGCNSFARGEGGGQRKACGGGGGHREASRGAGEPGPSPTRPFPPENFARPPRAHVAPAPPAPAPPRGGGGADPREGFTSGGGGGGGGGGGMGGWRRGSASTSPASWITSAQPSSATCRPLGRRTPGLAPEVKPRQNPPQGSPPPRGREEARPPAGWAGAANRSRSWSSQERSYSPPQLAISGVEREGCPPPPPPPGPPAATR